MALSPRDTRAAEDDAEMTISPTLTRVFNKERIPILNFSVLKEQVTCKRLDVWHGWQRCWRPCFCVLQDGRAQEFRGTISGAVTDPSGAVIPGARIVVKESRTGRARTKSDAAGQYVVPFLLPGDYAITATAQGFETLTRSGVTLRRRRTRLWTWQ